VNKLSEGTKVAPARDSVETDRRHARQSHS
jgi:hypothetical protein